MPRRLAERFDIVGSFDDLADSKAYAALDAVADAKRLCEEVEADKERIGNADSRRVQYWCRHGRKQRLVELAGFTRLFWSLVRNPFVPTEGDEIAVENVDGQWLIANGRRRAAILCYLNKPIPCLIVRRKVIQDADNQQTARSSHADKQPAG